MSFLLESDKNQEAERNMYLDQSGVLSLINQSFLRDDDDDAQHSRILKRSSKGLDLARKSVIQQQSEKYIMNKKKMPSNHNSLAHSSMAESKARHRNEQHAQRVMMGSNNNARHVKNTSIAKKMPSNLNLKESTKSSVQPLSRKIVQAMATEPDLPSKAADNKYKQLYYQPVKHLPTKSPIRTRDTAQFQSPMSRRPRKQVSG
jgi:hypothetical protein